MNPGSSGVSHISGKRDLGEGGWGGKKLPDTRNTEGLPACAESKKAGRQVRLGKVWEAWERGLFQAERAGVEQWWEGMSAPGA